MQHSTYRMCSLRDALHRTCTRLLLAHNPTLPTSAFFWNQPTLLRSHWLVCCSWCTVNQSKMPEETAPLLGQCEAAQPDNVANCCQTQGGNYNSNACFKDAASCDRGEQKSAAELRIVSWRESRSGNVHGAQHARI